MSFSWLVWFSLKREGELEGSFLDFMNWKEEREKREKESEREGWLKFENYYLPFLFNSKSKPYNHGEVSNHSKYLLIQIRKY